MRHWLRIRLDFSRPYLGTASSMSKTLAVITYSGGSSSSVCPSSAANEADRASGQYPRPSMAKVFVITGPSGVGKGTLIATLLERVPDLELSISATTREPRAGEVDGRDYHFLSAAEFDRRIEREDFLEFATYSGNRYGTLRSEVRKRLDGGHSVVLEIEVQGARQVRAAMRESIQVFICLLYTSP